MPRSESSSTGADLLKAFKLLQRFDELIDAKADAEREGNEKLRILLDSELNGVRAAVIETPDWNAIDVQRATVSVSLWDKHALAGSFTAKSTESSIAEAIKARVGQLKENNHSIQASTEALERAEAAQFAQSLERAARNERRVAAEDWLEAGRENGTVVRLGDLANTYLLDASRSVSVDVSPITSPEESPASSPEIPRSRFNR